MVEENNPDGVGEKKNARKYTRKTTTKKARTKKATKKSTPKSNTKIVENDNNRSPSEYTESQITEALEALDNGSTGISTDPMPMDDAEIVALDSENTYNLRPGDKILLDGHNIPSVVKAFDKENLLVIVADSIKPVPLDSASVVYKCTDSEFLLALYYGIFKGSSKLRTSISKYHAAEFDMVRLINRATTI